MAGFNKIMSKSREKDKPELSRAGCMLSGSPPVFSPLVTFVSTPTLRLPSRFSGEHECFSLSFDSPKHDNHL